MKKAMAIAVMAALIVSLSGCANTIHPQTIQDSSGIEAVTSEIEESTASEESSSVSFSESNESSTDGTVNAESESAQAEHTQPTAEQSPATETQPPQTTVTTDTPKPELPKTVEPTPTPEPKPTPEQQPTPPLAEEPPKVEIPQETAPPPEESAVPDFNINYWIGYAKSYAESIGLKLSPTAVDCWDNPIIAGEHSKYLERDITDCLNCYKNIEGFTGVWIWAEPDGNGAYRLYIGYE